MVAKESEIDFYLWVQQLHKAELLDQEFKVGDLNAAFDKFQSGQAVCVTSHWGQYPDFLTQLRQVEPSAEIGVMSPFGDQGGNRQVFPVDRGFYISAQMEDPDRFFEFLEWTLTDGNTFRRWGVEGETYQAADGQNQMIPDAERADGYKQPQLEPLSFIGPFDEKLDWDQIRLNYEGADASDFFEYVQGKFEEYIAQFYGDYRNPTVISQTEDEQGTQLFDDYLGQVADSAIIDHGVSKSDWLAAVDKWRSNGGDQIIAEVNEAQQDRSLPNYTES